MGRAIKITSIYVKSRRKKCKKLDLHVWKGWPKVENYWLAFGKVVNQIWPRFARVNPSLDARLDQYLILELGKFGEVTKTNAVLKPCRTRGQILTA